LLSVDRFVSGQSRTGLSEEERGHLLDRFGIFGIRLCVGLIRTGQTGTASELSNRLRVESGLEELKTTLGMQFAARSELLKARSALLAVDAALTRGALSHADTIEADLDRVLTGAHEFAEIRLLNALRSGNLGLTEAELVDAEVLLGAAGNSPTTRLGLEAGAGLETRASAAMEQLSRWQRRAEHPMSSRDSVEAARILVRTCEGMRSTGDL
jgi:hypothetical protein